MHLLQEQILFLRDYKVLLQQQRILVLIGKVSRET